jgi:hypothetical protein
MPSKKFCLLEWIFNQKTENGQKGIGENHAFTLQDISRAYTACQLKEPASISNTILDLTRKNRGIDARLPKSISHLGYDLRKKTGIAPNKESYAGEFVYLGVGNSINSWLNWPEQFAEEVVIINLVPTAILQHLSKDEGALFSVIDYCDVLSQALYRQPNTILRVQNPMKWQPNEIDGLYYSAYGGVETMFLIEAKALSTKDDINLEQMLGAYNMFILRKPGINIVPIAIQMLRNGMRIAVLEYQENQLYLIKAVIVSFAPPIPSWK